MNTDDDNDGDDDDDNDDNDGSGGGDRDGNRNTKKCKQFLQANIGIICSLWAWSIIAHHSPINGQKKRRFDPFFITLFFFMNQY